MSLLVTGSIGIDDVKTPFGSVENVYGGSAVYFSFAAKLFTQVRFVGVAGEDFPADFRAFLESEGIDLAGLEIRRGSQTFRWSGQYEQPTSDAETVSVQLNVLAEAGPTIPPRFADSDCVFLAATHPALQQDLVRQLKSPRLIMADTRDLWIKTEHDALIKTLSMVHGAILNDAEARLLTDQNNLVLAGREMLKMGPQFVVIKKGEHGAMLVTADAVAVLPAYPTTEVIDPTGAGDSFAGGMMGYLDRQGEISMLTLKRALAHGMIIASYVIEDFSLRRLEKLARCDVEQRLAQYVEMMSF
ncbi:MAG: sugar kinase [Phycisphaerales bacterium]|nr:sugar kinase [Phycisphaerales bacterium]